MTELTWRRTAAGFEGGHYRICLEDGRKPRSWRLEVACMDGDAVSRWVVTSIHGTRREAAAVAEGLERTRRKHARVTGHGVVGVVAAAAFAMVSGAITSPGAFVVAMVALFTSLRSFAAAVGVIFEDAWGWSRDDGAPVRLGAVERIALAINDRQMERSARDAIEDVPSRVLVLPPH
jgi:hypothetical protein